MVGAHRKQNGSIKTRGKRKGKRHKLKPQVKGAPSNAKNRMVRMVKVTMKQPPFCFTQTWIVELGWRPYSFKARCFLKLFAPYKKKASSMLIPILSSSICSNCSTVPSHPSKSTFRHSNCNNSDNNHHVMSCGSPSIYEAKSLGGSAHLLVRNIAWHIKEDRYESISVSITVHACK